jgi:serine/threonine-protein kinase
MSPEQARGKTVDRRTDIWAFGAVLYEMLTGSRTFSGDNVSDTIAQILTAEPKWTALPSDTPAPLRTLLRRCLEKDRHRRLDSATAARLDLEDMLAAPASTPSAPVVSTTGPRGAWRFATAALAAGVITGAVAMWVIVRPAATPLPTPSQFLIVPTTEHPLGVTMAFRDVALSPDGRYLAYHSGPPSGGGRLVVRALDSLDVKTVPDVAGANSPFFSPDSQWIGFFNAGSVKKVPLTGGAVITLTSNAGSPANASWGDRGSIVFAQEEPNPGLLTLAATGGEPSALTTVDPKEGELAHVLPSILPDERGVLFTIIGESGKKQVAVLDLRTHRRATLLDGAGAEYVNGVGLVFETSGTLFSVGFDLDTLQLTSKPVLVRDSVQMDVRRVPKYAASRAGTVAYVPAAAAVSTLLWVDRNGRETPINAPPRAYGTLQLSPDGTQLAVGIGDQERDIWIWKFAEESLTRLTFGPTIENLPIWMPNGTSIVFQSNRAGVPNLFKQATDGSGAVERLTTSSNTQYPNAVTPDGTAVFAGELAAQTGYDIRRFSVAQPGRAETFLATRAAEYSARVSPDGRFIAYQSTESGHFEIYVQPTEQTSHGRWQISVAGGVAPVWNRNGRELFYLDRSNTLTAVPLEAQRTGVLRHGRPSKVFDKQFSGDFYSYDVTPDGKRFIMKRELTQRPGIVVGLNWMQQPASPSK